jgi:uncharacterized circularly permuted ATP-grasp superfamily protein/uncharacterized alpha-E superfamily protein
MTPRPDPTRGKLIGDDLVRDYKPLPGLSDELIDPDGRVRPVWRELIAHLSALDTLEASRHFARGDQYLREAGVFYRHYGSGTIGERDWPLSHVPVIIHEDEWQRLTRGLAERADLLERIVADLYGENRLAAEGLLPATLIAANPEWLRPLVGVRPASGHFLHFLSFEVSRAPDGSWRVLGDRAQAPSGAGFALENRVATARVFSDLYPQARVHRLAGFFRAFREQLLGLRTSSESRAAILTPGPHTDTYYEHAYIARYLGMMLLEGEDLTVTGGRVMVRTVAGLSPVDVLWRRLDATWADPLELDETSRIGTPGLVRAIRSGSVTMVNALGSGVVEMRALLAFMPRISEALDGRPLSVPSLETLWCGEAGALERVRREPARYTLAEALSNRLPLETEDSERDALIDRLASAPQDVVAQEVAALSTTPVFHNHRLEPRPMSLRVFLARTATGWRAMPGGFARIGTGDAVSSIAMRKGASVADVWIVSDTAVSEETMIPESATSRSTQQTGVLPSRAADNLFWLGRYVERTEGMTRLVRAFHGRLADSGSTEQPLLKAVAEHLESYGALAEEGVPEGVTDTLRSAVTSAAKVRDRFSVDGWMALVDLERSARRLAGGTQPGDDAARAMSVLLRKLAGFSGLVHENMYRFSGWRFLTMGRALERALFMAGLLRRFTDPDAPEGALDLAIEVGDSTLTHRRRYSVSTTRETVLDLLALDPLNPRSVRYQMAELREQAGALPAKAQPGRLSELGRALLKLDTDLATALPPEMEPEILGALQDEIAALSGLITRDYLL